MRQRGTREQLAAELDDMAEGWWHLAKDRNSGEAAAGADEIRAGAVSVTVGHTTYEVVTESVQSATVD